MSLASAFDARPWVASQAWIRTCSCVSATSRGVLPAAAFKSRCDHVVVLNDAAWSIVQSQRGLHPVWVFPFRGRRIGTMNNNGWQKARRAVGLRLCAQFLLDVGMLQR